MKKPIIVFVLVGLAIALLFYFSHQPVFDVIIIDNEFTYPKKLNFYDLFFTTKHYQLTFKGGLILLICLIGLPALVAWRSTLTKYNRKTGEPKRSIWDKFNP